MNSISTLNKFFSLSCLAWRRSTNTVQTHRVNISYQVSVSLIIALFLFLPNGSHAAQLNLANAPLFLDTTVQPNIFYMLDDSGSMNWEHLGNNGAPNTSSVILDLEPDDTTERLRLCSGYNVLAYDPNVLYTPWKGEDQAGTTYADSDTMDGGFTNIRMNPYCPPASTSGVCSSSSNNGTEDLTDINFLSYAYFPWTDGDSDGDYDAGECDTSDSGGVTWTELASTGTGNVPAASQQRNFANWYSYYRKREYVLKRTVSELISQSQDRIGFSTLHNNESVGTMVADIDDITLPVNATAAANKVTLLDNLSQVNSTGGTPLRDGLDNVGRYYEGISQTALFGSAPTHTGTIDPESPILSDANGGACQQNFAILMTDGFPNGTFSGLDNVDEDGNSPDAAGNTTFDGAAYADTYDDTLADIAMHYYERDLFSSGLANKVPVTAGVDDADHQHMVTYTVAFGVNGTLTGPPPNKTDPFTWPDRDNGNPEKIDDIAHASYNGRGEFLSASDPGSLNTAISNAVSSISDRTGSASAVAVNSRSLNTNTRLYQARFTSGEWSGDLRAIGVNTDGTVGSQLWSSKAQLKLQNWDTGRAIITRNATKGIPFRWTTSGADALTAAQQTALNDDPDTVPVDNDTEGQARVNYIRGDTSNEGAGNNYRVRNGGFKFGDAVNSSPIFVGPPPFIPDIEAVAHSSFRTTHVSRREMVYIGANDGMLHGFDAATGDEKLAYVPAITESFTGLNTLTSTSYVHRYFVDGSPTVSDAYGLFSNGCSATACWRTVLVGSMGGGGKGVFALDVTDPDGADVSNLSYTEANAGNISLWEFTDTTTPDDMGYTYGQATITRVKTGTNTNVWAAIFANGYNSVNERAILYIVNIATGALIEKIDLSNGATGTGNGLSTPAVIDDNGDLIADYVFAGDLLGNMWKIDITDNNSSNWGSYFVKSGNPKPLFIAVDGSSNAQPITSRPEVSDHPDGEAGYMVYFGTGKYIENGDKTPSASPIQTFYGIWDENVSGTITGSAVAKVDRIRLRAQTLSVASQTINGSSTRTVTDDILGSAGTTGDAQAWGDSGSACNTAGGNCAGWRVDLLTSATTPLNSLGEMSVSNPVLVSGSPARIIFTTLIPETAGSCNFGGTSWLMELNPIHGGQLNFDVFGCNCTGDTTLVGINPDMGIMPEPVILHDPANSSDLKIVTGSTGAVETVKNFVNTPPGGRQSWRQLR